MSYKDVVYRIRGMTSARVAGVFTSTPDPIPGTCQAIGARGFPVAPGSLGGLGVIHG